MAMVAGACGEEKYGAGSRVGWRCADYSYQILDQHLAIRSQVEGVGRGIENLDPDHGAARSTVDSHILAEPLRRHLSRSIDQTDIERIDLRVVADFHPAAPPRPKPWTLTSTCFYVR